MSRGPVWDLVSPYLTDMRKSGSNNAMARCPFHSDSTPSFAINLLNGLWICHAGCGAGNLQTLLTLLGMSRNDAHRVLEPLQESISANLHRHQLEDKIKFRKDPFLGRHILPDALLGVYEYCPQYLTSRGFDPNLLRSFDIGYDRRLERVTFPIHDFYGNLVGISGRSDSGEGLRYKFYKGGYYKDGEKITGDFGENFDEEFPDYDIDKSRFVWNSHRAIQVLLNTHTNEPLILVEGFKACLWLIQCGFPTTVALMGSRMSETQADLIQRVSNTIVIFLDNNLAGIEGTRKIGDKLVETNLDTRVVQYPKWADITTQPDYINKKGLTRIIGGAERWTWLRMKGF
jgi:DNA primase